jgi:hypothetical protein
LIELDRKIFGKITMKEIIGSSPPAIPDTKNVLESELNYLINNLDAQPSEKLQELLKEQKNAQELVNSRPGAMALAQDKIRLFIEYNQKYIQTINNKLPSTKS